MTYSNWYVSVTLRDNSFEFPLVRHGSALLGHLFLAELDLRRVSRHAST